MVHYSEAQIKLKAKQYREASDSARDEMFEELYKIYLSFINCYLPMQHPYYGSDFQQCGRIALHRALMDWKGANQSHPQFKWFLKNYCLEEKTNQVNDAHGYNYYHFSVHRNTDKLPLIEHVSMDASLPEDHRYRRTQGVGSVSSFGEYLETAETHERTEEKLIEAETYDLQLKEISEYPWFPALLELTRIFDADPYPSKTILYQHYLSFRPVAGLFSTHRQHCITQWHRYLKDCINEFRAKEKLEPINTYQPIRVLLRGAARDDKAATKRYMEDFYEANKDKYSAYYAEYFKWQKGKRKTKPKFGAFK